MIPIEFYCFNHAQHKLALSVDLGNTITLIYFWGVGREVVKKEVKLFFPPTKLTFQEVQGIPPLFLATGIKKNKKLKWRHSQQLLAIQIKQFPLPHVARTKPICPVSPAAGSCHESFTMVLAISSLGERPKQPSRNMPHSKTTQHHMTSPVRSLFSSSASSHPPYIYL